jgi:hypothetical protein
VHHELLASGLLGDDLQDWRSAVWRAYTLGSRPDRPVSSQESSAAISQPFRSSRDSSSGPHPSHATALFVSSSSSANKPALAAVQWRYQHATWLPPLWYQQHYHRCAGITACVAVKAATILQTPATLHSGHPGASSSTHTSSTTQWPSLCQQQYTHQQQYTEAIHPGASSSTVSPVTLHRGHSSWCRLQYRSIIMAAISGAA